MFSPDGTLISASAAPHCGFMLGLRKTFIKRYIVERTNKAELRPEEQSEKAESCRENLWGGGGALLHKMTAVKALNRLDQNQARQECYLLTKVGSPEV